jgi:hypothetical protein
MDVADSARIEPSDLSAPDRSNVEEDQPAQANQDPKPESSTPDDGRDKTPAD